MDEQAQFQAILDELNRRASLDPQLRQIMKKIEKGKANFTDTALLSQRMGNLLGELFGAEVLGIPEDAREAVCEGLLRRQYDFINEMLGTVQRAQDKPLGISLNPIKAPFPAERVQQVAHSLLDLGVKPEVIRRRANAPVATVAKSFHDDYIRINAQKRNDLGFKCYLNRVAVNGCCSWCTEVAGRYVYGDHPADIFRRHDNCDCTVTFENGRQRQDVWSKRTWDANDPEEVMQNASEPTVLSQDAAESLQNAVLSRLTLAGERDIINEAKVIDSMFYADDYEYRTYTKEEIIENLKTSEVGLETIQYLEDNPQVKVKLSEDPEKNNRGEQEKNLLSIWLNNCPNVRVAAQTVVHEVTHHKYGIGGSQQAETICFAFEKMHKENRKYLTQEEWDTLVEIARTAYWNLPANGGVDNLERFGFVVKKG